MRPEYAFFSIRLGKIMQILDKSIKGFDAAAPTRPAGVAC
jgi:hypothetical protein